MVFFPVFAAMILAIVVYLHSDWKWWTGLSLSGGLLLVGLLVVVFLTEDAIENPSNYAAVGLFSASWVCGLIVGLGALVSLIFRKRVSAGRLATITFVGGLFFFSILAVLF